jgi:hypothetical protein
MENQVDRASRLQHKQQPDCNSSGSYLQLDQHPGQIAQRKIQAAASEHPDVKQLRSLQAAANASQQVRQLKQIQSAANPIQTKSENGDVAQCKSDVIQCYRPGKFELKNIFQIYDGKKWTIARLEKITDDSWIFETREGFIVEIDDSNHEDIRPSTGGMAPSISISHHEDIIEEESDEEKIKIDSDEESFMEEGAQEQFSDEESDNDKMEEVSNPYGSLIDNYNNWNPNQKFQEMEGPFGKFNAKHNRKSVFLTSNKEQYPETNVKTDYKDIIQKLKKEGISDKEIAEILLEGEQVLKTANAIRAAAMLTAIVYMAEQWRKHGAVKIFRALLRRVQNGDLELSKLPGYFEFVASAQDGREQVERIRRIMTGEESYEEIQEDDRFVIGGMSPYNQDDFDSDDDLRDIKDKDFKEKRDLSFNKKGFKKVELNEDDVFQINGTFYNIAHRQIRTNGECLWDTLIYYGVDSDTLQQAAADARLTFNDYVDDQDIQALVDALANRGENIQIELDVFTYAGEFKFHKTFGKSNRKFKIGLVFIAQEGHYVPGLN